VAFSCETLRARTEFGRHELPRARQTLPRESSVDRRIGAVSLAEVRLGDGTGLANA